MQKIRPMGLVGGIAALGLWVLLAALPALAEPAWVTGEVRLNLRSGPGNQHQILGVLTTGDPLQVLERSEDWAKVRTAGGQEGWVPGGFLQAQAPAALAPEEIEAEVARVRSVLESAEAEASDLRRKSEELSANDSEQKAEIERLTKENYRLHAGERWAEWITGALVLSTGMALGALLSRISSRRQRQRLRL